MGSLGEDEWLAHIKIERDKSERSAIKRLRLYERNIKESRASASRSPKVAQPTEPLRPAVHADDVCLPTTPARARLDWRSEAVRIFELADKDHNGQLDMSELLDVRSSEEYAEKMMKEADTSKTGSLSEDEWLAHIKIIADKSERSAIKLLRLYERNINSAS